MALMAILAEGFRVKVVSCRGVQGYGPYLAKGSVLRPSNAEGFKVKAFGC